MRKFDHEFPVHLLLVILFGLFSAASGQNCVIPLGSQPDSYLPLFFSSGRGLLHPINSRAIVVRQGERVEIVCPGQNNFLVNTQQNYVNATCQQQGILSVGVNFAFKCNQKVTEELDDVGQSCGALRNSAVINIGWQMPRGFSLLVEVCFNQGSLSTEYTEHMLRGSGMRFKDRNSPHQSFRVDTFFSRLSPPMSTVYNNQQQTLAALLGSRTLAAAYIGGWGRESYLARGHLSPDADFSLVTSQDATYHYINAVPQWQAFNNGNWKALEDFIRTKASQQTPRELIIFTGTHGVLELPDVNNNSVKIFLLNSPNKQGVPVPKYIWKVVFDEQRREAVAFVLLNYPNNNQYPLQKPSRLCPDVCNQISWVRWANRRDRNKGLIYCCTVASLRSSIPNVPRLRNVKLFV